MQKLVWQNANGVELDLTSGNYGITEWEGFSNASLNIQSQQVPFQDGGVFLDALIEQRELSVTLAMQDNNNLELRYQNRRELISALNPKLGEGYLIYTNDFISKRIKCVPQIPLFETHNSDTVGTPKASLSWTACEPYWEDLEETIVTFGQEEQPVITNNGDIKTSIQVEFFQTEENVNPKIRNITEQKEVQYEGTLTDNLKITTETGSKNVVTEQIDISQIPINSYLYDIKRYKGLYIACGQYGTLLTSPDCKKWTYRKSGIDDSFYTIAYFKSKDILVISGGNNYLTSEDGINWKVHTSIGFIKLFYDEETDMLYGIRNKQIYRTIDAENWEVVYSYSGTESNLYNILLRDNNGLITIISDYIITSADGENWNETLKQGYFGIPRDMIFQNGVYLALGSSGIGKSSDGINWIVTSMSGYDFRSIVYWESEQKYIISSRNRNLLESSDGDSWSEIENSEYGYKCLVENNNLLVVYNKIIKYTSLNQSQVIYKNYQNAKKSVVFKNRIIIVGGSITPGREKIYYSDDELQTIIEYSSGNGKMLNGICASENIIVACGLSGTIITSYDGKVWSVQDSHTNSDLYAICYSKKLKMFFAVGIGGIIIKSSDGINWNVVNGGISSNLTAICYSEKQEKFVVVGAINFSAASTDGENWVIGDTISASNIDYSDDLDIYIAGGSNKNIYKSNNGTEWEIVKTLTATIESVKYIKEYGYFIIGCYFSSIFISSDGLNWSNDIGLSQENTAITSIVYDNKVDKVYFIGDRFFYSELKEIESVIDKLTVNSDMNIGLEVGKNIFYIYSVSGIFNSRIKYRQKYIGV